MVHMQCKAMPLEYAEAAPCLLLLSYQKKVGLNVHAHQEPPQYNLILLRIDFKASRP